MKIAFQADPALLVEGGRRAQRWAAVDPGTGRAARAAEVLAALADGDGDDGVRRGLLRAMQSCPFHAAFWECPPLLATDVLSPASAAAEEGDHGGGGFEFVLVDAPELLASVAGGANPDPFAEHLEDGEGKVEVRCFANLGGDADLVSPTQATTTMDAYGHLLAFVKSEGVPEGQKLGLLGEVGRAVLGRLRRRREQQEEARPVWVSTSGLGVAWLHVRVEDRPKYYTWLSYVGRAGAGGGAGRKSGRRYG